MTGQDSGARELAALLRPVASQARAAAILSVAAALVWPVQAALVALALGGLLTDHAFSPLGMAIGFFALAALRALLVLQSEALSQRAAEQVIHTARLRITTTEAARAEDSGFGGAGAIAALAGEKLEMITPHVVRYAPARLRVMLVPPVLLALAVWQSWAVGIVLIISGPLIPVFMALVGMSARDASARQLDEMGTLNDLLVERLSALIDIRVLGAGGLVEAGFARTAAALRQRTMAVLRVAFLSSAVLELFAALGVAMVAVYVGFSLLGQLGFGAWGAPLSIEAGIFLLLLAPEFYQPLRDLATAWHDRAAAEAVADELAAWHAAKTPERLGAGGGAARLPGPATISLAGCVTLAGRALPEIAIGAGERVALVGPSGVGKSSALAMMAGLIVPARGQVIVAGQALDAALADAWRARLGWMPQVPHFLNASLRHNLTRGQGGDVTGALQASAIAEVVAALPQGLNTRLGEGGGGLSGGEARRLMLARVIQGAPDVILADEPTADLDAATAQAVTEGLLAEAARGATLVVATHDERLAAQMDRIIRIGDQP